MHRRSQASPFRRALLLAATPALCLVVYVAMWAGAMRTGYYRNGLQTEIRQLSIENNSLQAEVRRLQSPARIFHAASTMRMQRPIDIRFVQMPLSSRVARR